MTSQSKPRSFTIRLERPDRILAFQAREDEYLLYSMVDAGIESPFICEQGWCLACAARLISGEVDRQDALTLYPEDVEAGFVLLCSTKPRSDIALVQDERQTRREMTQHRIERNQLARAYPPGARSRFRRGRVNKSGQGER
jgi:ferredoxin